MATLVALGGVARRLDVGLGARPPDADEVVHRVADRGRFLDRGRVHHAPAPHQHPVRVQLAADLQPGRLLLEPRMGDRELVELVAVLVGQGLEGRDRLLAVGAVVVDQRDLLALELVHAAFLIADVLDQGGGLAPVGHGQVEDIGEDPAVGGVGPAVAHRQDRDLVGGGALDQRVGDAGAVGVDHRRAGRTAVLQAFIALDAAVVVVGGLALLPGELDAADAAVALVDQVEVVVHAVGDRDAVRRVGSGAIDQQRNELLAAGQRPGREPAGQVRSPGPSWRVRFSSRPSSAPSGSWFGIVRPARPVSPAPLRRHYHVRRPSAKVTLVRSRLLWAGQDVARVSRFSTTRNLTPGGGSRDAVASTTTRTRSSTIARTWSLM